jgi:hypothetical protein
VIVLTYFPLGSTNSDPSDPAFDIFSAVPDQLGTATGTAGERVNIRKVERIDKVPTEK